MTMRFSLSDTAAIMKHIRTAALVESGLTVSAAYTIAEQTLEKLFHERHPSQPPAKAKDEPASPRVPCTEHRERSFTFSDGTVMRACSHHQCGFGKTTKRHSDGRASGALYALDIPDAVEEVEDDVSPDDTQELSVEGWASAESTVNEDGEAILPAPCDELEDEDSEKADDGVMLECE